MRVGTRLARRVGGLLRMAGDELVRRGSLKGTWIDVGAHRGETTIDWAILNPCLRIYALEPNLSAAATLMGRASNYFVIPMAVAENDGLADFHVNEVEVSSSLLTLNEESARNWAGGESLRTKGTITVPTIRLDTLMNLAGIERVDFLKIDAQGMDLAVVKSAGARLRDIAKITLEVDIKEVRLYSGAPTKDEVIGFLGDAGFSLAGVVKQTYGQEENLTFIRSDNAEPLHLAGEAA